MKSGLAQDSVKSAKTLAQAIAKQMAREPLEVLDDIKEQTTGPEVSGEQNAQNPDGPENQKKLVEHQNELQDKMKSTRRMEALDRELVDIRKQGLFKDLQAKIAQGVEVPLEDYPELSPEQKQVLKAQMEAVKVQMENAKSENGKSFVEPASKKGRQLFNFGKKQSVKNEQTRVEKPMPPSG
jgi:hypothetical protein